MAKFTYYNNNPYRIEEKDCVCRAISNSLMIDYKTVASLLKLSANENNCDMLCVCCYHYLLEKVFNLKCEYAKNWERVEDIADKYCDKTVIIRIDGHLTMCKNGVIYDLWDCRKKFVDCFWIVDIDK